MCGGFDYRAVEGELNQGANTWYTKTPGAPDILLHYNYYEVRAWAFACVGVRGRAWACVCTCVHMCAHVSTAFVFVRSRDRAAPSRRHAQPPIGTENRKAGLKRAKTEQEQPPPMAVLCLADAIFQAMREHIEGCRHRGMPVNSVLEEGVSSGDDDEDEGEEEAFKEVPIADAPAWALKHGLVPKRPFRSGSLS